MNKKRYKRFDGSFVKNAYDDFELKKIRNLVLPHFKELTIRSVLAYGRDGSVREKEDFDQESRQSAKDFFSVDTDAIYEAARNVN